MPAQTKPTVTIGGTFLLSEFGSPRIESIGAGEIVRAVYALHFTKDNLSFWVSADIHIASEELSNPHVERYGIGFVSNKDRDYLNFAPSEDGVTIAGPEGLDYEMLLEIFKGETTGTKFAEIPDPNDPSKTINEIELCQGHRLVQFCDENGRPFLRKLPPSNFTQLIFKIIGDPSRVGKEGYNPLVEGLQLTDDLSVLEGYVFDWQREEQDYKMKDKDGKEQEGYDVLVPVALVRAPEKSESKNKNTGGSKAKSGTSSTASNSSATSSTLASNNGSSPEYPEALTDHIYKTLAEMSGPQTTTKWASKALKSAPPELKAVLIDAKSDTNYLYNEDRPWSFDQEKGTLEA